MGGNKFIFGKEEYTITEKKIGNDQYIIYGDSMSIQFIKIQYVQAAREIQNYYKSIGHGELTVDLLIRDSDGEVLLNTQFNVNRMIDPSHRNDAKDLIKGWKSLP